MSRRDEDEYEDEYEDEDEYEGDDEDGAGGDGEDGDVIVLRGRRASEFLERLGGSSGPVRRRRREPEGSSRGRTRGSAPARRSDKASDRQPKRRGFFE